MLIYCNLNIWQHVGKYLEDNKSLLLSIYNKINYRMFKRVSVKVYVHGHACILSS